jgi:hypothetical protein
MFKRFVLLIVTVLLATFSAYAESKHYRSGVILAAEITKANISVANLSSLAFPNMPRNRAYAVISVKLDPARELSIFDYSLEIKGQTWPCAALYRNNRYEYTTVDIHGNGVMQMLFIVDSSIIPASGVVNAVLKSNLSDARFYYDAEIPCKIIGSKMPAAPHAVPASGLLPKR